jgi:nitrate/nitrite-specific signal transduction histidine kinase
MTLGRKIILRNMALVVGVGLLAASSLWGLLALRAETAALGSETSELNHLLNIADEMAQAKNAILSNDLGRAKDLLQDAITDSQGYGTQDSARLTEMKASQPQYFSWDKHVRDDVAYNAGFVEGHLPAPSQPIDPAILRQLESTIVRLQQAVRECQEFMARGQLESDRILQIALILVGALSALILCGAVLMSQWYYQSVMVPLDRLRQWVRRVGGAGEFPPPMEISGDLEFCELTVDVNQMA